jgi:hypothetical protein
MLSFFSNLPIRNKILITNSVTVVCLLLVAGLTIYSLHTVFSQAKFINENTTPTISIARETVGDFSEARLKVYKMISIGDPVKGEQVWQQEYIPLRQKISQDFEIYSKMLVLADEKKSYERLKEMRKNYLPKLDLVHSLSSANNFAQALSTIKASADDYEAIQAELNKVVEINQEEANTGIKESESTF